MRCERHAVNNTHPVPDPLGQCVRPILGLPAWGVKQGYGSFLTLDFGEPMLEVSEQRSGLEGLQRSAYVHGQWHLWIYCCHWRVLHDGAQLAWSEDNRDVIEIAACRLNGQKLSSTDIDPQRGRSNFRFDLGGSLETWPYGDDPSDPQWILFADKEVFTYRADGRYKHSRSDEPDEARVWLPFP